MQAASGEPFQIRLAGPVLRLPKEQIAPQRLKIPCAVRRPHGPPHQVYHRLFLHLRRSTPILIVSPPCPRRPRTQVHRAGASGTVDSVALHPVLNGRYFPPRAGDELAVIISVYGANVGTDLEHPLARNSAACRRLVQNAHARPCRLRYILRKTDSQPWPQAIQNAVPLRARYGLAAHRSLTRPFPRLDSEYRRIHRGDLSRAVSSCQPSAILVTLRSHRTSVVQFLSAALLGLGLPAHPRPFRGVFKGTLMGAQVSSTQRRCVRCTLFFMHCQGGPKLTGEIQHGKASTTVTI